MSCVTFPSVRNKHFSQFSNFEILLYIFLPCNNIITQILDSVEKKICFSRNLTLSALFRRFRLTEAERIRRRHLVTLTCTTRFVYSCTLGMEQQIALLGPIATPNFCLFQLRISTVLNWSLEVPLFCACAFLAIAPPRLQVLNFNARTAGMYEDVRTGPHLILAD